MDKEFIIRLLSKLEDTPKNRNLLETFISNIDRSTQKTSLQKTIKKRERKNKNDDAIHRAAAGSGQETDATKARAKVEGQRPKVKGRERRERTFARTERLL